MWFADALEAVFPRTCAGCGVGPWPFCDACRAALRPLTPPWCERCGRPSSLPVPACRDCPPPTVASVRAPFVYDGPAKAAIHRLKFTGWREVAAALAASIAAMGPPPVDVVTWVPLARRRLAERGYDQARALATSLGQELGLPVRRIVRRIVSTRPQARRPAAERRRAMLGVFAPARPAPPRVLLVDDVLTTGATAAACAEALLAGGAHQVHVVAAARSLAGGPALRAAATRVYPQTGSRSGLWLPGGPPR